MKYRHACLRTIVTVTAGLLCVLAVAPSASQAETGPPTGPSPTDVLYQQTFSGGSAPQSDWIAGGANGNMPCLTAGNPGAASAFPACPKSAQSPSGQGVLRLTTNANNQTGYALYTHPIQADRGLRIAFNMYQYDATTNPGADGISFILLSGTQSPAAAGAFGGALGYKGLAGGYLGVGFDEFGNYSNMSIWGNGKQGRAPNSIVVRGAQAAKYPEIVSTRASQPLAVDTATNRSAALRHVVIEISTSGAMTVKVNYGKGMVTEVRNLNLNDTPGQPLLPPTVKFGFAASTGSNTAIHEISGLTISALPPDLQLALTSNGLVSEGGKGTLTATVSDKTTAGPTIGPVTATINVPQGMTPVAAQGNGWTCSIAGQQVTCTSPATLQPGSADPPITITTSVAADAPPQVTVTGNATTPDQFSPTGGNASVDIPVASGPRLSTVLKPIGQFLAPGTGTYLLAASNSSTAGPTVSPVTETVTVPAQQTVLTASGNGWACSVNGQVVTCTTQDILPPGQTYPVIAVNVLTAAENLNPVAQVGTANDTGLPGETSPPVTVQVVPASTTSTTG
jgi:Bacterial lectin